VRARGMCYWDAPATSTLSEGKMFSWALQLWRRLIWWHARMTKFIRPRSEGSSIKRRRYDGQTFFVCTDRRNEVCLLGAPMETTTASNEHGKTF